LAFSLSATSTAWTLNSSASVSLFSHHNENIKYYWITEATKFNTLYIESIVLWDDVPFWIVACNCGAGSLVVGTLGQ
jgi:hypothetical protein